MSTFYLIIFAGVGAYAPFLSLYLHRLGVVPAEIGVLMAIAPLVAMVAQPAWGLAADTRLSLRTVLSIILAGVAAASLILSQARSFGALALALGLVAVFQAGLMPIADTMAMSEAARSGGNYADRRLFGSLGFALSASVGGWFFARTDLWHIFIAYATFSALAWLVARRKPLMPEPGAPVQMQWADLRELGAARGLWIFIGISAMIAVVNQAHSAFFSIYLDAMDARTGMVGFAWTVAAVVEIPAYFIVGRMVKRYDVKQVAVLGFVLFAFRFYLYSVAQAPWHVIAIQVLAGVNFVVHQATAVILVWNLSPPAFHATGQTLYGSITGGMAAIAGSIMGGQLVQLFGHVWLYRINATVALAAALISISLLPAMRPFGRPAVGQR